MLFWLPADGTAAVCSHLMVNVLSLSLRIWAQGDLADETTVRFWKEIYDDAGKLVETHEKLPVDKGHQKA